MYHASRSTDDLLNPREAHLVRRVLQVQDGNAASVHEQGEGADEKDSGRQRCPWVTGRHMMAGGRCWAADGRAAGLFYRGSNAASRGALR